MISNCFLSFLDLEQQQQQASLLIDVEGLTRVEGKVNRIEQDENIGKTKLIIDSNEPIDLAQVIAVNGLFRDDYSECRALLVLHKKCSVSISRA